MPLRQQNRQPSHGFDFYGDPTKLCMTEVIPVDQGNSPSLLSFSVFTVAWLTYQLIFWHSEDVFDVTLCSCMSKWADMPEVSLISAVKGEEPIGAWMLCNSQTGCQWEGNKALSDWFKLRSRITDIIKLWNIHISLYLVVLVVIKHITCCLENVRIESTLQRVRAFINCNDHVCFWSKDN